MGTLVSLEDAMGQEALATPTEGKPRAPVNALITLEEATGTVQPATLGGFLTNKQSYKDMAGYAVGVGAQLNDMFTGLGKSLLGGAAYLMERADSKGSMTAPAPRTADAPPVTAAERASVAKFAKGASAKQAQVAKDMFPDELATPWKKVAEAMGPEALAAYNDNGVGWVMGKISEVIEKGGKAVEGAAGIPASDVVNALDLFTGILGARALKPQAQAMLKQRIGQMRSDMKAAKGGRNLTPEELATAYEGTRKFRPGDETQAKPSDFEATQELPAFEKTQPLPGFEATQEVKAQPAAPRPLADVLDPYKVPAIAAGATGATAWALQEQLDDEQLAALGVAGAAAIVRLDGVPEVRLVDMLKQGGPTREAAAAQIYRDNVPKLTRSLRKYERQGVEIEDVVQRTMEKGLRAMEKGSFAGDAAIGTYLYRIAENEVMSGMRYEKVRPKTESMDLEETPGIGKGDEARPSAHENIADESLTGRSPEQVALNNALGKKMAAAMDSINPEFRRAFEMSELEGLPDAEIARELNIPVGTVKSRINRAKEQLQQRLREYGPGAGKVALVAGAGSVLASEMDDEAKAALGAAAAMGAMKPKGGMWNPLDVDNFVTGVRYRLAGNYGEQAYIRAGGDAAEGLGASEALNAASRSAAEWATKAAANYLNKHAGTATDPLKDLILPDGTRWEDVTDQAFGSRPAKDYGPRGSQSAIPGLNKLLKEGKVSPDEPIYQLGSETFPRQFGHKGDNVGASVTKLNDYLVHVADYLIGHVPLEKLPQYDLVRAVKETKAWDDRMAKEAAKAAEREANTALKRMETMTVVQEWPGTGLKLVKLDKPGDFAHESTVMGHSVRGYEPHRIVENGRGGYREDVHPDWVPESEKGVESARYASGDPSYGLGGWDAIKRGDAEILSLRDSKGMSHVTIEVEKTSQTPGEFYHSDSVPASLIAKFDELEASGKPFDWEAVVRASPEYKAAQTQRILQIRGKGNAPVPERYQQAIADFLNSREWDHVGDLDNAGIYKVYDTYMTDRDVRPLLKRTVARVAKQDGYTPAQLDSQLRQIDEMDARGVQWAVNRRIQDLEHTLRMERVAAKRGEKLETPEAYNPRDVFGGNQRGSASLEQIFTLAAVTAGGTLGAFLDEESPLRAGIYGALGGGFMASAAGRRVVKQAIKSPDWALGLVSTRLGKIAPELKGRLRLHELRVLKAVDTVYDQVTPFLDALRKQPAAVQEMIARDLLNGKTAALKAIPALASTYPKVQATLKNIEGQLQGLGRFAEGVGEYFPRIVKDMKGLRTALGKADPALKEGLDKALADANAKMMRKEKRALTDVEESIVTNRYLFQSPPTSGLPGYAKGRRIKEVTEKLQPFYETPAESLLRYLSGSITDIETARFFGRDLKVNSKGQKKFTNVDESIGNLTASLLEQGKITPRQAIEVRDILQARFQGGQKGMNAGLTAVRNLTNTALLGQVASAATQIGDSFASIYHYGLGPTLQGVIETLRGRSKVTPKELGLVNHLAEELSDRSITGRALHTSLKYTGFQAIDLFAKQLNINAALAKARGQARTAKGRVALAEKYGYAFEGEMPQLIADLQANALTPRTQRLAFETLSDIQPVSRAELPQAYLEHPNWRLLYQLKTYMLKQADIVRRDAYDNIASGDPKKMMTGIKNLGALATLYAFSNVPGDAIKDWLSGREVDVLSTPQLVENVFKTFGLNRYSADKLREGKVVETGIATITPPLKVLEDILAGREKAVSYIPGIGRPLYDRAFDGNVKREIAEKRAANKGLPKGTGQELSDEAKEYLERKRQERKARAEEGR